MSNSAFIVYLYKRQCLRQQKKRQQQQLTNESNFLGGNFLEIILEKGQLLKIHLLEKTARHQNLDCSTLFEQMSKKWKLLENQKNRHFEQMQVLDQNEQLHKLRLLDKSIEKCQLLEL